MSTGNDIDLEVLAADPAGEEEGGRVIGGPALPDPVDEEQVSAATDGSVADRLAAIGEKLKRTRTHDFRIVVPDEDDQHFETIVMRARAFTDRKAYLQGVKTEVFIIRSTQGLFLTDEDTGDLLPIPTWGPELAAALGIRAENASELVRKVFGNPAALETFGASLLRWMARMAPDLEQSLGE
jgi:hypothetical protein